ncbi:MAG: DUF4115 domain-containing protein [Acidimicrobiales bacterium]
MIALVLVGLALVVALAVAWSRVGLARSERRSMKSYEHALHVLGDVAKRSDAAANVRPVAQDNASRGHVLTESWGEDEAPIEPMVASPSPPQGEPRLPPRARLEEVPVHFEDNSDAFERAREKAEAETVVAAPIVGVSAAGNVHAAPAYKRPRPKRLGTKLRWGRISAVAAAVLVMTGIALVGVNLAASNGRHPSATGPGHHRHHVPTPIQTTTVPAASNPPATAVAPVSASPSVVAFVAPKGTYTLALADTGGSCWVGIQTTPGGGYVWQQTLVSGQSTTYKASGPLIIRIGAPRYLEVKVNGLPARLPGYVQPYDLTFNPASQPSAA